MQNKRKVIITCFMMVAAVAILAFCTYSLATVHPVSIECKIVDEYCKEFKERRHDGLPDMVTRHMLQLSTENGNVSVAISGSYISSDSVTGLLNIYYVELPGGIVHVKNADVVLDNGTSFYVTPKYSEGIDNYVKRIAYER